MNASSAIHAGDPANAALVSLFNHNGTHMDLPNHYYENGRRVADYDIAEFIFERPVLIEVRAGEGAAITAAILKPFEKAMGGKDFVFLRTGFGEQRDLPGYLNNPYLTPDAARLIRSVAGLRGLGIDFLSVGNPQQQKLGDEVHRILLDRSPDGKPVLIIEDMDLSAVTIIGGFRKIFAVPLFVEGVDGMPCTVFGEYEAS